MIRNFERLVRVLDRARTGTVCTVADWDKQKLPGAIGSVLARHGLRKTCDPLNPVNTDTELADRFFRAGYELALETGILCVDTERIITVTADELDDALATAEDALELGRGTERIVLAARRPESRTPALLLGTLSLLVDEALWLPVMTAIHSNRRVALLNGLTSGTILGTPMLGGTPLETVAGLVEAERRRQVAWATGRRGIPQMGISNSTTEMGHLGGAAALPRGAVHQCLAPAELKTSYGHMNKIAMALGYDGRIRTGTHSFIGGYSGPPEGAVVTGIAADLLQFAVHQAHIAGCYIFDIRYNGNCGRHALWAQSVAIQALTRNTGLVNDKVVNQTAGPCTEMLLRESAAGLITVGVSGAGGSWGPRSASGRHKNHVTPLEVWFSADVLRASAQLDLAAANDIVKSLVERYEADLDRPPRGKPVQECFDLTTLAPSDEWGAMRDRVTAELRDLGLPL